MLQGRAVGPIAEQMQHTGVGLRTFGSEAGEEPFDLPLRLAFRPASVYVVTNTPADVAVAGGAGAPAQGRARRCR